MLPSGYLQLEYIRATGIQYINTGYSPQSENVIYECEWLEESLNAGSSLFGSTNTGSSSNKWTGVHYHPSAGALYSATGATDGVCSAAGITAGVKNTLKTTINNGTVTMLRNGTTYTGNYAGSIRNGISIGLFADKRNSDVVEWCNNLRMYSWRMTDSGVLVRDMVPAERLSDGAVGMYDTVNDVFYGNAGTGVFAKGKYVVDESQIVKLEYLESTGTQYIDTGFVPNQDTRVYAECVFATASSTQGLFGARTSSSANQYQFVTSGNYYRSDYNTTTHNVTNTSYGTSKFYVDKAKNVFDLNGDHSLTQTYAAFTCPGPMYIFATNNNGSVYAQAAAKIYSLRIYGSDALCRDYYPAKLLVNGTIGLWDAVTGMLYTNAGTGSFVAGPYLADEKDVVLLEYIESSGTQHIDSGYKPNEKTQMTLVGEPSASGALYCANNASGRFGIYLFTTQIDMAFGSSGYVSATKSVSYPETVTLRNGNLTSSSGTYSFATQVAFQTTATLPLFAEIDKPSPGGRIYSAQIFEDNEIERDYYPARFIPTSEAGLYDAASGTFYINAGTGAFIEGPEIPQELGAPDNLRVESVAETAIVIAWDAVGKATGYKVFRNYVPVAENATTTYTDYAPEPYNGYVYGVVAYNDDMQSAMVTVRAAAIGSDPIRDLVTDRTQEDVDYVLSLMRKGLNGMTDDEKTEFTKGLKGAYNATDLNRVESAVEMLPAFLNGLQASINSYLASIGVAEDELYRVPYERVEQLETKRDWSIVDIPYADGFARYLANIVTARGWLSLPADTPAAPDSINRLTYTKANAIEQILLAIYNTANEIKADKLVYADRAKDAWKYCGTFNCGQEVIF